MTAPTVSGLDDLAGARVAVWGIATEGRAVIGLAAQRGATVTVVDDAAAGTTVSVDGRDFDVHPPSALGDTGVDVVIRSPGVSRYRQELVAVRARGTTVTTAMALWLSDFRHRRVIAVTGSKGKSTTVVLAEAVLSACGRGVAVGGNIGKPVTDFYSEPDAELYVVEVSSFQASEVTASPPVGILTLVAPDHLDWHGTAARYVADKLNLFRHRPDIVVAVNAADPGALEAARHLRGRADYGTSGRVTVAGDHIAVDGTAYLEAAALPLRGHHNLVNLCGAITGALLAGEALPDATRLTEALRSIEPLPSRLHTVTVANGIEFVDDALASNPAGTVAALRSFPGRRVALIAGGHDRGVALDPLMTELAAHDPVPAVVTVGETAVALEALLHRLAPAVAVRRAGSVAEAVPIAVELLAGGSGAGDAVVLFSPAAPTPPDEGSYADRSTAFRRAVEALGVVTGRT